MLNIFSTLKQGASSAANVVGGFAGTINQNLQNFGGDVYDTYAGAKQGVQQAYGQAKGAVQDYGNTIARNVSDASSSFQKGARDLNYKAWDTVMKNTPTWEEAKTELNKNTGGYDRAKLENIFSDMASKGYTQEQAMEVVAEIDRRDPSFLQSKSYGDKIRQSIASRGDEFGKTYKDFSSGKIGFGEAALRNAGDILGTAGGVIGNTITEIPGVEPTLKAVGGVVSAIPGVKQSAKAYEEFAQANPRAAENLQAIGNIVATALGSTQGQAMIAKGVSKAGEGIKKVAEPVIEKATPYVEKVAQFADDTTSAIASPIVNGTGKVKNILTPLTQEEKILKSSGLKTVTGQINGKTVEVPSYGVVEKGRTLIAPKDTKVLAGRALSPRGTGLSDKQKLQSVANAESNVRNYHALVRTGKLKGDLSDLQTTAQSVVDNMDEVGSKIGNAIKNVDANVSINNDTYKAIGDAIASKGANRTPTAKILQNFVEDTSNGLTIQEAFNLKKIYNAEITKLIASKDAGTPQFAALLRGVDDLTSQIDDAVFTKLKGPKFKELKSQYRLLKSMVGDITNSAMVEGRRAPQSFAEQLGTIQTMSDIISSPIGTAKNILAREIGEINRRGGSWKELIKRLDQEAISAYKKASGNVAKAPIIKKK